MSRIRGSVDIARPVVDVFDFVADLRNEPSYNPRMTSSAMLTEGPVRVGTRFRATVLSRGKPLDVTIEVTGFDRPRRIASRSVMAGAVVDGCVRFEPVPGGTRFSWDWEVTVEGPGRFAGPLITLIGNRQEQVIWTGLKHHLEDPSALDVAAAPAVTIAEVHLEELGEHSWIKALANTATGSYGSAQFRFVARAPGSDHRASDHLATGATFPVMRFQDLDDQHRPNAWIDTAEERLEDLDEELRTHGWRRTERGGEHWWSRTYVSEDPVGRTGTPR